MANTSPLPANSRPPAAEAIGTMMLMVVGPGSAILAADVMNGWGDTLGSPFGLGAVIAVEILFTALLIFVVLGTTTDGFPAGFGGLAAGLTLAAIHIATIPVDNTSVNPARSIGAAVFAGSDHLGQVWAFIVFPLLGGALGWGAHVLLHGTD